jgi:DNA-binding NarL/FixJ family response regulator
MLLPPVEPSPSTRPTILIVDDHSMLRRGLTALIESDPGLGGCSQAATRREALEAIRRDSPDLVIVDLALGDDDGLELVKEIKARHPSTATLVFSMHDESVYAERCLKAGALGYVCKQRLDETLLVAIHRVLGGDTYMSAALAARLAARYLGGHVLETDSPLGALSDREQQVFAWIGRGRTTRQIAQGMNLSIKTIESHRGNIKRKLAIETSAELAQRATRWVETGRGR